MFAFFPVWMLSVMMGFLIIGIGRMLWLVYSGINVASGLLAVAVIASAAMPFLMVLIGKFMFVIPIATFERMVSIEALARAGGYVRWGSFLWAGSVIGVLSAVAVISLIMPTWCFYNSLWGEMQPVQHSIRQVVSIMFTCITAPSVVIMITTFYFAGDLLQDESVAAE